MTRKARVVVNTEHKFERRFAGRKEQAKTGTIAGVNREEKWANSEQSSDLWGQD